MYTFIYVQLACRHRENVTKFWINRKYRVLRKRRVSFFFFLLQKNLYLEQRFKLDLGKLIMWFI